MTAIIQLTLDGSLVHEKHKVSLRTLSHSMFAIQSAVDRAYLDVTHGHVWKHARLPVVKHPAADFLVGNPEQGSYVIEFVSDQAKKIVIRIREALRDPYGQALAGGEQQIFSISEQIEKKKGQVANSIIIPQEYDSFLKAPDRLATRAYGDKSINKEINQLLIPVRRNDDSLLKLVLKPSEKEGAETFTFTQGTAHNFKKVISSRQLGDPVVYQGRLRELDRGHNRKENFKGKFTNLANGKDLIIHIQSADDFSELHPFLDLGDFTILACPIIEYSSYDPVAGDIQFLKILANG